MGSDQHLKWILEGVEAWNARRERDQFQPDLSKLDIRLAFEEASLIDEYDRYDLQQIDLSGANASGCKFSGVSLRDSILDEIDFTEADLWRVEFQGATLKNTIFRGAKLDEANFRGLEAIGVNFSKASLILASFRAAKLPGINFYGCNLNKTTFRGTNLSGADLRYSNATEANFIGANLTATSFSNCNLQNANLSDANLQAADFRTTVRTVDGVNYVEPHKATNLRGVEGLTQGQLNKALGDSETLIPDHLDRPPHWPDWREIADEIALPERTALHATQKIAVDAKAAVQSIATNRDPIALTIAILDDQLSIHREALRGNNFVEPQIKTELIECVDDLLDLLQSLRGLVHANAGEKQLEEAEAESWLSQYVASLKKQSEKYSEAENVAGITLPTGIILGCTGLGSLLGMPVAGAVVGGLITNHLSPGKAAEKLFSKNNSSNE